MTVILQERVVVGRRLGRHINHDPRSKRYETPHKTARLVSAKWKRHCRPFDQKELGSCTGNALAGVLMTDPFWKKELVFGQADAISFYSAGTELDDFEGSYPPDDTGSSGLAVAEAARRAGFIKGYSHAFDTDSALASLGRAPVMVGIPWYDGFDEPDGDRAELRISGIARGGHEVYLLEIDVPHKTVRGCNSWGDGWGDRGYFTMSFSTLDTLLKDRGDCTIIDL